MQGLLMKRAKIQKYNKDKYVYYVPSRNLVYYYKKQLLDELEVNEAQFAVLAYEGFVVKVRMRGLPK